jgi:hypothetical protein
MNILTKSSEESVKQRYYFHTKECEAIQHTWVPWAGVAVYVLACVIACSLALLDESVGVSSSISSILFQQNIPAVLMLALTLGVAVRPLQCGATSSGACWDAMSAFRTGPALMIGDALRVHACDPANICSQVYSQMVHLQHTQTIASELYWCVCFGGCQPPSWTIAVLWDIFLSKRLLLVRSRLSVTSTTVRNYSARQHSSHTLIVCIPLSEAQTYLLWCWGGFIFRNWGCMGIILDIILYMPAKHPGLKFRKWGCMHWTCWGRLRSWGCSCRQCSRGWRLNTTR